MISTASRHWSAAIAALVAIVLFAWTPAFAQTFETRARQALLMDADTGAILYSKDANKRIPPASLAKLMTMEVVFNQLKSGKLQLTDKFFVSENAWRNGGANSGGSTMFAVVKSEISLEDLIRGVVIQSANDGCIIIAEGLAGSEAGFAALMNERARALGLDDSHFTNSTGLPDPAQYVTVADLGRLAQHIINTYPEYFKYYSEREFTWNKITQKNRNPLLDMDIGADGMKTGFTEESGYAIVGTVKRDNQRLIAVLSGMETMAERAVEARKIVDWGSRAFEKVRLFEVDEIIGEASVYGGEKSGVGVTGKGPIEIYLPIGFRDKLQARIVYTGPLLPPVEQGAKVGVLQVSTGEQMAQEVPVYAAETVAQGGLTRRSLDAIKELVIGLIPL